MPDASEPTAARSSKGYGQPSDFDRPLDVEDVFKKRHNGGAGHGTLGDNRAGFVRLRRKAWDELMALQRSGALTHQETLILVGLLTRAGYRPERMGVVLGSDREVAESLGVHRNRLVPACRSAEGLGILEQLVLDRGSHAGWRFTRTAWLWLAGEHDHPAPAGVLARLAQTASSEDPEEVNDPFS